MTNTSYVSTFLPVLFGLLIAAPIYKWFNKIMPSMIKGFMTPLLTLLITFPLTFLIVGPLANMIGTGLNTAMIYVFGFSPLLAGIILGGLWQVFVLFGYPRCTYRGGIYGSASGKSQPDSGILLRRFFCDLWCSAGNSSENKEQKVKELALPSFISAIFGVTEPATYGITMPQKKMFALCCVGGGAASGVVVALANLSMETYAGMGIIGLLGFINPEAPNFVGIVLMAVIPFVVSLALVWLCIKILIMRI